MAKPKWEPLSKVERDSEVGEGEIALPKALAEKAGSKGELVVRCRNSLKGEGRKQAGPPPDATLRVEVKGTSHAAVAPSTYRELGVGEFGLDIEGRRLKPSEWLARKAFRVALPLLVLVAAIAAVVGLLWSNATFATEVVTVVAAVPAAIVALCRASAEP